MVIIYKNKLLNLLSKILASNHGVTIVYKGVTEMYETKKLNMNSMSTLSVTYISEYMKIEYLFWISNKNE